VPFWQRLNEAGLRVGLVNVPFTYPADSIDGFVVTGFGAPEQATEKVT
jgi:predicted AlkP superfamily phosphohydrolase/phosphomutase